MVQNETNEGIQISHQAKIPSAVSGSNPTTYQLRLFENINILSEGSGEKKKKVGNYIISKTIGEGSFAKVRLGFHIPTQQKVAVKVINKQEVLKRNYLRANLRREACMMQRMQHPNIIQLYEVMETENCYYIVMELIDGIEFVKYLSKKRVLDENETRQYIRQIVSAVDHMHEAKVVHRDIKLQNFMLDQNYNLVIIDFGLSNSLDERDFLNTQCGSPAYAAPEIFAHRDYRCEVDIWSIGVNMYAMLAGKLPFKVENRSKNLAKLHACILKGCEIPSFLSSDCQDLLKRLLDPSPNLRIKMNEIVSHPWINYQTFPIQLIHYKPCVEHKEIKANVVKYLIQKYGFTEPEITDAIINRKPVTVKAMYYLSEKFLIQKIKEPSSEIEKRTTTNLTNRNSERDLSINERARQASSLLPKRSANSSRRINIQKSESAATQRSSMNSGLTDYDTMHSKPPGSDVTISKITTNNVSSNRRIKQVEETPRINYETLNNIYNKKYTSTAVSNEPQTITKSFKATTVSQSKYKNDLNYSKSESYDQSYKNKFLHQIPSKLMSKLNSISPSLSEHQQHNNGTSDQLLNSRPVDNYILNSNGNSHKTKYSISTCITPGTNQTEIESKFKNSSYFKPSTTLSDTAATLDKSTTNILRSRQLHLGKARIDLDSPQQCKIKAKPKSFFS